MFGRRSKFVGAGLDRNRCVCNTKPPLLLQYATCGTIYKCYSVYVFALVSPQDKQHSSNCSHPAVKLLTTFTASRCPARDISVPQSKIYCTNHVSDSTRTAAPGLLPLLVRPSGTVFRTLSAIRTPPKLLPGAC